MTPEEERRKDADMRRLFDKLEQQDKTISELIRRVDIFIATRDMEITAIKAEQKIIADNQECILQHLNRFKAYLWAGSIVVVIVVGLGKAVLWLAENVSLLEVIKK